MEKELGHSTGKIFFSQVKKKSGNVQSGNVQSSLLQILTGEEMEETDLPDQMLMESYLSQLYEIFRREIPHIQHPRLVNALF